MIIECRTKSGIEYQINPRNIALICSNADGIEIELNTGRKMFFPIEEKAKFQQAMREELKNGG